MLTNFSRTSLAIGLVLANAIALAAPAAAGETTLRNRLAAGSTLTVKTFTGFIHITRGSGDTIVQAVAHPGDRGTIDMHVAESRSAGSWTICEVHLDTHSCDGDLHSKTYASGRVDLTISVPEAIKLDLKTVSGDVAVADATSDVAVGSVSGDVKIATTGDAFVKSVSGDVKVVAGGTATAKTVSGNVNVRLGTLRSSTSFDSVSGTIALAIPHDANAKVSANTLSGDVTGGGDIHFGGDKSFVGHNVRATLGQGSTPLDIHTVSGSIDVTTI
jgi:hypothetical protein